MGISEQKENTFNFLRDQITVKSPQGETISSINNIDIDTMNLIFAIRLDLNRQLDNCAANFYRRRKKSIDKPEKKNRRKYNREIYISKILVPEQLQEWVIEMFQSKVKDDYACQLVKVPLADLLEIYKKDLQIKKKQLQLFLIIYNIIKKFVLIFVKYSIL